MRHQNRNGFNMAAAFDDVQAFDAVFQRGQGCQPVNCVRWEGDDATVFKNVCCVGERRGVVSFQDFGLHSVWLWFPIGWWKYAVVKGSFSIKILLPVRQAGSKSRLSKSLLFAEFCALKYTLTTVRVHPGPSWWN
jgi:hypothetical protein